MIPTDQQRTKKIDWREVPIEKRLWYFANQMHIDHPQFVRCLVEIKRRMLRCKNEGKGSALAVLCPSGCGKTYIRNYLERVWPNIESSHLTTVPVISFEIPLGANVIGMAEALLSSAGDPCPPGSARVLTARIIDLLPKIGTRLILIDNVQDVPEKRGSQGMLEIGGWIRRLVDDSKVMIVLLGTFALPTLYKKNGQAKRRSITELHINPFYYDDDSSKSNFSKFLNLIDERLPLAEKSDISSGDLAERIFHASYGIPDFIFKLLNEAVSVAVAAKREKIIRSDLAKAFILVYQDKGQDFNPFIAAESRPMDQEGEPFFDWYDSSNPEPKRRKRSRP